VVSCFFNQWRKKKTNFTAASSKCATWHEIT